jgi:hypothetical protein
MLNKGDEENGEEVGADGSVRLADCGGGCRERPRTRDVERGGGSGERMDKPGDRFGNNVACGPQVCPDTCVIFPFRVTVVRPRSAADYRRNRRLAADKRMAS